MKQRDQNGIVYNFSLLIYLVSLDCHSYICRQMVQIEKTVILKTDISFCCIVNEKIIKQLERKIASKDKRKAKEERRDGNMQCLPGFIPIAVRKQRGCLLSMLNWGKLE